MTVDPSITIRPIAPADADALVEFHSGLSADSTRLRYFSPHPRLSPQEVEHFTHVDHHDREALVAFSGDELIGVARLDRLTPGNDAEMAFIVADAWQGHGIATTLLQRLAAHAATEGIDRLVADTLAENHAMIEVFQHAGFPFTRTFDRGVAHFVLNLAEPVELTGPASRPSPT